MKFIGVLLVLLSVQESAPVEREWILPLKVRDREGHSIVVRFGYHDSATVGFDRRFGEVPVPPVPGAPAFDVRFLDPRHKKGMFHGLDAYVDIRGGEESVVRDTFYVRYQPANESFPVVFSWPSSRVPQNLEARIFYRDSGAVRSLDMSTADSLLLSKDAGNVVHIVCTPPQKHR